MARPTANTAELSLTEQAAGTPILEAKVKEWKPEVVVMVGKSIWEAVWRWKTGRGIKKQEFMYGWQDRKWDMEGARVFVATSTSGLAAGLKMTEKVAIWKELGDWVVERRRERETEQVENGAAGEGEVDDSTE